MYIAHTVLSLVLYFGEEHLNNQFQSVFTTETEDPIPNKELSTSPHQKLTITTPGITKLLNNINPHKATGPDNISGHILKELQEQI